MNLVQQISYEKRRRPDNFAFIKLQSNSLLQLAAEDNRKKFDEKARQNETFPSQGTQEVW
jgi:hypothetical protein